MDCIFCLCVLLWIYFWLMFCFIVEPFHLFTSISVICIHYKCIVPVLSVLVKCSFAPSGQSIKATGNALFSRKSSDRQKMDHGFCAKCSEINFRVTGAPLLYFYFIKLNCNQMVQILTAGSLSSPDVKEELRIRGKKGGGGILLGLECDCVRATTNY